jgi:hypothetical protein
MVQLSLLRPGPVPARRRVAARRPAVDEVRIVGERIARVHERAVLHVLDVRCQMRREQNDARLDQPRPLHAPHGRRLHVPDVLAAVAPEEVVDHRHEAGDGRVQRGVRAVPSEVLPKEHRLVALHRQRQDLDVRREARRVDAAGVATRLLVERVVEDDRHANAVYDEVVAGASAQGTCSDR